MAQGALVHFLPTVRFGARLEELAGELPRQERGAGAIALQLFRERDSRWCVRRIHAAKAMVVPAFRRLGQGDQRQAGDARRARLGDQNLDNSGPGARPAMSGRERDVWM